MLLHEYLGITYPLMQGGMAQIATGSFAAAVSNAGALGIIGAGGKSCKELKAEIDKFADGAEQADDITMLALRYKG